MIGSRLADRYEIVAELGRGGRGVVYRAKDPILRRQVAIKVVPPALSSSETDQRFQREATLVAQMDHPAIVPIFDFGRDGGTLFFVMPVLEGETLRDLFRRGGLSLGETLEILAQVADALDYSHARDVIHRDIKPENVMVTREREGRFRVRVMDFGLAQESTDTKLTRTGQLPGTLAYLCPEQVLGLPLGGRCDLYALGAMLYEALRGEPPFTGSLYNVLYRIVHDPAPPLETGPGSAGEGLPAGLAELVMACLEKDPAARPARAAELAQQLRSLGAGLGEHESARPLQGAAARSTSARLSQPLIGRAAEMAEAERRLEAALGGEGQLILIGGEAGVGKSRLLAEIEERAAEKRFRVLRGRFAADDQGLPFHGLYEPIQDYFRWRRSSSSALAAGLGATGSTTGNTGLPSAAALGASGALSGAVAAGHLALGALSAANVAAAYPAPGHGAAGPRAGPSSASHSSQALSGVAVVPPEHLLGDLAARLVALFPPLGEIPELRQLAAGLPAEEPQKALDLFELLARTYSRLATAEPLLLSLENLHHDPAAAEALQYIVRRLGSSRILVAATWRTDHVDKGHPLGHLLRDFADDPRCAQLLLAPLAGDEYLALLGLWLGAAPLRSELALKLQAITEGNPLFTREIVASWRSSGELRPDESGRLSLRDSGGELPALPATVQQAVAQRLSHLAPELRGVLEVAAVLGRVFSEKALLNLLKESGSAGVLGEAVDELLQQGLLQEERAARQELLRFAHGVVHDVLYLEIPRRRRRRLHRRHAEWLEERHAGKLELVYPQLLAHWSAAEVADKTGVYAALVAARALASFSPQEAIAACRRGLELAEEAGEGEAPAKRAELLALLARAHRASGEPAAALLRAEQAAELFAQLGQPAEATKAAALAADVAWQARRAETAERWLARGLEWARALPKDSGVASGSPRGEGRGEAFEDLLRLAATTAGLRGERERSLALLTELEALQKAGSGRDWPLGGEIVAAMASEVAGLDPGNLETDEASEIGALVYETLASFDAEGHLLPWLAAGWQEMGEGRIYVVDLRPDATFSDGSPLLATDVRASLLRAARLSASGSLAPGFYRVLKGIEDYLAGASEEVAGIEVAGPHRLVFRLTDPLPIFPVLLADMRTSVAALRPGPGGMERLLGSGPFRIEHVAEGRVRLERVAAYWRGQPARLDAIEFQTGLAPGEIATGLRRGRIDLGRDLLPADLDALLVEPRFRSGLVERTRKNVYFALLNDEGPLTRHPAVRRALAAAFNTYDLVWRTLGRFAQPATSLIPPGMLGHDPGRRPRKVDLEAALAEVARLDLPEPRELRLLVHPVLLGKYRPLLDALAAAWRRVGFGCTFVNQDRAGFHGRYRDSTGIDILLARWNTDYDDPDNFTYNVFHSKAGIYHAYYGSAAADDLLERARRLRRPAARAELYRDFEDLLADDFALLPLFYDVDYRLAGARLRGLELRSTYPYVSYAELAQGREPETGPAPLIFGRGGELEVPSHLPLREIDPLGQNIAGRLDVVSTVFETLLRLDDSGRLMPHLAAAVDLSADGLRLRLRLRPGLAFHDGRPLTPRDVQASFERLIRRDDPTLASLLMPIRGAAAVRADPEARLAGCHLTGRDEILIELERPYFSFPVVLTHPATSIVPAGLENFGGRWRDGVVGSGPFRIADLIPGERLELERNPHYWRAGLPHCERLIFHLGCDPARTFEAFVAGRLALAGDLSPEHVETLLAEPPISCRLFQAPRLSTHFLLFNSRSGFFAEHGNRRRAIQALDLESYRRRYASRLTTAARGLIPPALLGLEQRRLGPAEKPQLWLPSAPTLRVALHGCYRREYAALWQRISEDLGGNHELIDSDAETFPDRWPDPGPDLVAFRWIADYPDAGSFLQVLHFFAEVGMLAEEHAKEIAQRIAAARLERELPARRAHYLEVEALLEQECLVLPLFHEQAYRFAAPDLSGLRLGLGVPEVRYEELRRSNS